MREPSRTAVENQNLSSIPRSSGTWGASRYQPPTVPRHHRASVELPSAGSCKACETFLNEEGVVIADLDFDTLAEARAQGEVSN